MSIYHLIAIFLMLGGGYVAVRFFKQIFYWIDAQIEAFRQGYRSKK